MNRDPGQEGSVFPQSPDLLEEVRHWSWQRIRHGSDPSYGARSAEELARELEGSICAEGIGESEAMRRFEHVIIPTARPNDNPYMLSYIPAAPTAASICIDLAISAAEIFGGNWESGSGAVHAENQALQWLAERAGLPAGAGGTFVAGGTMGNLSALHAAREQALLERGGPVHRWAIAHADSAHSSIAAAARVMGARTLPVPTDAHGRMNAEALDRIVGADDAVAVVVATAGTTNAGIIDPLDAIADVARRHGVWLHVDGAYGLAGLASDALRPRFAGIEHADSFIVDPHKWLFAPYDACAVVYRDPSAARAAHTQQAAYLEQIDRDEWNPSDFAIHLSRRVRGLPLWFSLATYGTDRYATALDRTVAISRAVWAGIHARSDFLEPLLEPDLTVLMFRRRGWNLERMKEWSEIHRRAGTILCVPTFWQGEPAFRLCFVNPETDPDRVLEHLDTMAE